MKITTLSLKTAWRILLLVTLAACTEIASTSQFTVTPPIETLSRPTLTPPSTSTPRPTLTPTSMPAGATPIASVEPIRFAVIGDYGDSRQAELDVSNLVKSWEPDFIITVGDNNYPAGEASTIDENIGHYYHEFIHPYIGTFGEGADVNRFFPILGNHDWDTSEAKPYLDYFELPGNERYYDFVWGPIHFFALDSDLREPDGIYQTSPQAFWLKDALASSTSPWNIVYMHHPPYSSGKYGASLELQWPFAEWGADAVLSGHDHTYERVMRDGIPYFINGLGGGSIYTSETPAISGSAIRFSEDYGAMLVDASESDVTFQFVTRTGLLVDTYVLSDTLGSVVQKDTIAPQTYIAINAVEINPTTAIFKFASSEPGTLYCSLDGSSFSTCTSPMKYTNLQGEAHEFQVYAVDTAGNVDTSPAQYRWAAHDWRSSLQLRGR